VKEQEDEVERIKQDQKKEKEERLRAHKEKTEKLAKDLEQAKLKREQAAMEASQRPARNKGEEVQGIKLGMCPPPELNVDPSEHQK